MGAGIPAAKAPGVPFSLSHSAPHDAYHFNMPANSSPSQGDRRPIAARNLSIIQSVARALARRRVHPNFISLLGMAAAIIAGILLYFTREPGITAIFPIAPTLLVAALLIQLRLLANLLDGMVAVEGRLGAPTGPLYNELPDRISDTAVLVGMGYALHSNPSLGWAAAAVALFITTVRLLGSSLHQPADFSGPMAKQQRMNIATLACALAALIPSTRAWDTAAPGLAPRTSIFAVALIIIIAAGLYTAARRTLRLARAVRSV